MASQIRAPAPGAVPMRSAVSGVMGRLRRTISCMRCGGTQRRSANAAALMPHAPSYSFRMARGCTAWNFLDSAILASQ